MEHDSAVLFLDLLTQLKSITKACMNISLKDWKPWGHLHYYFPILSKSYWHENAALGSDSV